MKVLFWVFLYVVLIFQEQKNYMYSQDFEAFGRWWVLGNLCWWLICKMFFLVICFFCRFFGQFVFLYFVLQCRFRGFLLVLGRGVEGVFSMVLGIGNDVIKVKGRKGGCVGFCVFCNVCVVLYFRVLGILGLCAIG